jgi:hypothetical protein
MALYHVRASEGWQRYSVYTKKAKNINENNKSSCLLRKSGKMRFSGLKKSLLVSQPILYFHLCLGTSSCPRGDWDEVGLEDLCFSLNQEGQMKIPKVK